VLAVHLSTCRCSELRIAAIRDQTIVRFMRILATESFRRGYSYVVRCYFRSYRAEFLLMRRLRAFILPTP